MTLDDLKKQLEAAKQAIQELESRMLALEAAQAKPAPTPAAAGIASVTAEKEKPKGSFEVYGFAQMDAIQDFNLSSISSASGATRARPPSACATPTANWGRCSRGRPTACSWTSTSSRIPSTTGGQTA